MKTSSMLLFKKSRFLFALLLFIEIAVAQTIPCKNITVNDGLPSNDIKCFFKDSRGLLWIGTESGLCCYDGTTFKIYNETNGLKHDKVWSIVEDENQNLWLSLYGKGLAKYDGKKFTYFDKKDGLVNNSIRKIHYSKKHKCLILATEDGLSLFDGKQFKSFIFETTLNKFQIMDIDELSDKILITVSHSDVMRLTINSDLRESKLVKEFSPLWSYSSIVNKSNYFGGGTVHKLFVKNLITQSETTFPCPIVWDFAKDSEDNIYCASWNLTDPNGGLFKYSNNKLTDITKQANIQSKSLWCLFFDKETKQLWVGSVDKGIYRLDLSNKVKFFTPSYFGLKELQIQELYNDVNNRTWIGAKDNIILLHKDLKYTTFKKEYLKKKLDKYIKRKGMNLDFASLYKSQKLKYGFTSFNFISDNVGNIWANTTWGVICFDKNYKIIFYKYFDGGHLIFDNKDQAYYGSMYSNVLLLKSKFDWTQQKIFSIKDSSVPRNITKIVKKGNSIWFASNSQGLFLLQNGVFWSLNANGLFKENNIKDLIINEKGQLIIGTNSGRVYVTKWDGKNFKILKTYKPYKDIYGTSVSFVEQSKGVYYIGTNKGINVIKNDKFIKLIDKSEGLQDIQFNDCVKDKKGNLWVGTNNGLFQLDVDEFSKTIKTNNTPIQITSIKVNGKSYPKTELLMRWGSYDKNKINLEYNQNNLEITFTTNNTYNAEKNLFRYKIIGLNDTWSDFEPNGRIQLLGISNGNYKILLEGKNIGTGEIFQSKTLDLIITPPFWKTAWFIISSIICFSIVGFIVYKKRIHRVENRERAKATIQKRLAETKMEALQSQMNPHFIFNAMNSIQNYIIDNNVDDALMYMGEFSKLIRQTLNNSSQQRITLKDEIRYLKSYITLENMRFKNRINFILNIDDDLDVSEIEIPPMLIQPFIENVFVHAFDSNSKDPTLLISMQQIENCLLCEIKDNGKGMANENLNKLNTSKGIQLAKERIALFQNETDNAVTITSSSTGTTIVLKLQITHD
nr:histidine kinase [uncultured Flavobacterium sp.]